MTSTFDATGDNRPERSQAVRPRDAATLVLVRRDGAEPRILMGRRSRGHAFMPDKYVFPGGRVEAHDGRAPALSELPDPDRVLLSMKSRRQPRAFALAAIRETFEETGLVLGRPAPPVSRAPREWSDFYGLGVAPCLKDFRFLGRAITPPMRSRRFDARFFMASAEDCLLDERPAVVSAELDDLHWFTLPEALTLELPNVTRFVLGEVRARLDGAADAPAPFHLYWTPAGSQRDRLEISEPDVREGEKGWNSHRSRIISP